MAKSILEEERAWVERTQQESLTRVRRHCDTIADLLSTQPGREGGPPLRVWRAWYQLAIPVGNTREMREVVAILRKNGKPAFGTNPVSVSYVTRFDVPHNSRDTLLLTNEFDPLEIVLWLGLDQVENVRWVDEHSGHRLYS